MALLSYLDAFCSPVSVFWGYDSFNASSKSHDEVDLTLCFEDTAILYSICTLFYLLAALEFICSSHKHVQRTPFGYLQLLKLLMLLPPLIAAVCDLSYTIYQGSNYKNVAGFQYFTPAVIIITMESEHKDISSVKFSASNFECMAYSDLVAVMVLTFERSSGLRSSGLTFLLWLALSVYGSFKFRTLVLINSQLFSTKNGVSDVFRMITFCITYVAFLVEFLLVFFAEPKPISVQYSERAPCPEETATFLSKITWWWQNGQIWKGWRHPLTHEQLTDLNQVDKSSVVAPHFQRTWDQELRKSGMSRNSVGSRRVRINSDSSESPEIESINTNGQDRVRLIPQVSVDGQSGHQRRHVKNPSLLWALTKTFGSAFMFAALFKLGQDLLGFASPQILKLMINFTEDRSEPSWKGYLYAVLLFVAAVVQSLLLHQYFHRCFVVGMRMRTAIVAAVYRKSLKMSSKARRTSTVGEIVNLMSVDAQRFMDLVTYLHMIWSAPLQIIIALIFLWFTMGASIFAGFFVMVLLIPINAAIAAKSRQYQVKQMVQKDSRIKLVNEVLNGIKVIKLYAWEIPFQRLIMNVRKSELNVLKNSAFLNAGSSFTWTCAPFLVSLATFATYALVHQNSENPEDRLTADKVFVALSLFNIIRFPLSMLPMLIMFMVQTSVSLKRLQHYLKGEELDPMAIDFRTECLQDAEESVSVTNATFTWDSVERPTLSKIDLHIKQGELVAVVGHVGAGKSSLVQGLLGEMEKVVGNVTIKGQISYVPQQAWIQNATVKDNILFGKAENESLYQKTIKVCALEPDLQILPGGDQTEIGEKGINLSGGQKQRVSLARAVYQEADVYFLDDPLSAVDSHVGKHIFDQVIGPEGILNGKTRVLVTHGIGFLPQCDKIVVMDEGQITEMGSYAELIDNDGSFAEFIRTFTAVEEDEEGDPYASEYTEYDEELFEDDANAITSQGLYDEQDVQARKEAVRKHLARSRSRDSTSFSKPELMRRRSRTDLMRQLSKQLSIQEPDEEMPKQKTVLIQEEKAEIGMVKFSVIMAYIKSCTFYMMALMILFYILTNGASVGSNFWLAHWSNQEGNSNTTDLGLFLGVYAGLGLLQALFVLFGAFTLAIGGIFASKMLHDNILSSIMRAPMSFFDTTPLGRILNRFSKDVYTIDETIPSSLRFFLMTLFSVISTILVIVITTPIFLVVILPLGVVYFLIQRLYVATSRQLKRLDSITRSPIYTHFQETINGVASIRAYRQQDRFIAENEMKVDTNQIAYYPSICANRWLAIRLEFIGNLIIFFAALFATIQRNYSDELHLPITPGSVGLSISYALQVTSALNFMVRMTSELETNIVAVERTEEYAKQPSEAPAIVEANRPPPGWPTGGHITFKHYSTRYREGLDLVLKDIVTNIPAGMKIGIVGRTGAGKSSLTLALFRIIEPASGEILIDGYDITQFGLQDLRSRITIIPQDPVLFFGSLRMNLDPFENYSDEQVWRALESAHLKTFVTNLPDGLQYPVSEGGENLSVGQRQLVCLARALLRKTKILVLDEATAAVDLETDELIQKTIRAEFADCTIVTIAHRLNTIIDYDCILVLDAGAVAEFDSPDNLLNNKKGLFYSMAKDAGLV